MAATTGVVRQYWDNCSSVYLHRFGATFVVTCENEFVFNLCVYILISRVKFIQPLAFVWALLYYLKVHFELFSYSWKIFDFELFYLKNINERDVNQYREWIYWQNLCLFNGVIIVVEVFQGINNLWDGNKDSKQVRRKS